MEAFSRPETLELQEATVGDLSPLLNLPALKTVILTDTLREQMDALAGQENFSVTYE